MIEIIGQIFAVGFLIWLLAALVLFIAVNYFMDM